MKKCGWLFIPTVLLALSIILYTLVRAQRIQSDYQVQKVAYGPALNPNKLTVVASFDGCRDLDQWKEILAYAQSNKVKFTFFISGVYFLADDESDQYVNPVQVMERGVSEIGFGGTPLEVKMRKGYVLQALQDGHDVESHLNGHFDGSRWTEDMWGRELQSFHQLTLFLPRPALHVRIPHMAPNFRIYSVLPRFGIHSLSSKNEKDFQNFNVVTTLDNAKPYQFFEFPMAYANEKLATLLIKDNTSLDPAEEGISKKELVDFYLDEAARSYKDRRPLFLSHHFPTRNQIIYWDAMQQTLLELKKKYRPEFLTISELNDRLMALISRDKIE